ncbi:hypothetical protein AGABI1DRAFT_114896 [Agaricus bisporus var. burnettii JB137-S8]|uniref:Uncharacterized protein n=1 Tax=Agaricus bisporus var. burnettii (strain JB137-S8 / ATCC MYA-4627 / FGSC 10392) TaxID=597362 RepID=K5X4K2_AGABU|nr:uncharacterized protein AGABI1DRAFT_114896 [Agaricus bisporus var. burnettii JB137-S8]EKM78068.1 hypothetical protein AGABI1DRAFT_114896 [Agaricus bisporus var. burnettii JB137-S8]
MQRLFFLKWLLQRLVWKQLWNKMAAMRADFGGLRQEVGSLRQEVGNIRQELGDGLRDMRAQIALTNTRTMNLMIRKDNMKRTTEGGLPPMPVHKVVAGSGIHKAQALLTGTGVHKRHAMDIEAHIGEVPEYPDDMQHEDILQLIVFYNEDFGIERDMDLEARRKKVRLYLL